MIYAALAEAVLIAFLAWIILRSSERASEERAELLDRIQHPEVRRVDPGPKVVHEPPRDMGELAMVGQIVPEHVKVGTPPDAA
jgi:hypothetical protein